MKKLLTLTYPLGSLIIEGTKGEVSLMAQIPSRGANVMIRDWAVVDMQGALKLAFLGSFQKTIRLREKGDMLQERP